MVKNTISKKEEKPTSQTTSKTPSKPLITSKQPKKLPLNKQTSVPSGKKPANNTHAKTKKRKKSPKPKSSVQRFSLAISSASSLPIICAVLGIIMVCFNMHLEQRIWRKTAGEPALAPRYSLANPDPRFEPEKYDQLTNTFRRSIFTGDLMQDNLGNTTTTPPFLKSTTLMTRKTTPNPSSLLGNVKLAPEKSVCTFGTDLLIVMLSPARDHRERQSARLGWLSILKSKFQYASYLFVTSGMIDVSVTRSLKNEAMQKGDILVSAHNDAAQKPPFNLNVYMALTRYIMEKCPRVTHVLVMDSQHELNMRELKTWIDSSDIDGLAVQAGAKATSCSSVNDGVEIPYCSEVCFIMSGPMIIETYKQMQNTYLLDNEGQKVNQTNPLEYLTGYIREQGNGPPPEKFNTVEPICTFLPKFQFKVH